MRIIRSFNDVQQVLRDFESAINEFRAKVWDLNQRRITNVHPSQNEYDVVVRKELFGSTAPVVSEKIATIGSVDYDVCIFGVGINLNIATGTDVCPRFISAFNGSFTKCFTVATYPSTGCDIIFDIIRYHNSDSSSIFSAPVHITAGSYDVQFTTSFAIANIYEGDTLGFNVLQVGSDNPGSMVVIKLKIKRS